MRGEPSRNGRPVTDQAFGFSRERLAVAETGIPIAQYFLERQEQEIINNP